MSRRGYGSKPQPNVQPPTATSPPDQPPPPPPSPLPEVPLPEVFMSSDAVTVARVLAWNTWTEFPEFRVSIQVLEATDGGTARIEVSRHADD